MRRLTIIMMCVAMLHLLASCSLSEEVPSETSVATALPTESFYAETTIVATEPPPVTTVETIPAPPAGDDTFVPVADYIPGIVVDLKYATADNFTGQVIYSSGEAWLRYGTVKKLAQVQQSLQQMGLGLKLWDGFRPPAAQFKLWEICPDPTYVANPNNGFSSHSRGNTVDITVVDAFGNELVMPTGFDDFSLLANRDYTDCTQEAAANAQMLEDLMKNCGFKPYFGEWWHFTDTDTYEVEMVFVP